MRKFMCTHSGCNAVVNKIDGDKSSPRCPRHQLAYTPKKVYEHQTHNNRYFYHTTEWRSLRNWYFRQHPICEICEQRGLVVATKEIDHIIEIQDGGAKLDPNNLQALCPSCHRQKTGKQKRNRQNKKRLNGFNNIDNF